MLQNIVFILYAPKVDLPCKLSNTIRKLSGTHVAVHMSFRALFDTAYSTAKIKDIEAAGHFANWPKTRVIYFISIFRKN